MGCKMADFEMVEGHAASIRMAARRARGGGADSGKDRGRHGSKVRRDGANGD